MGYGEENLWAKFKSPFVALIHNIDKSVSTLLVTLFYYFSPCWHATCYMLARTNLVSSPIVFTMPFKWEDALSKTNDFNDIGTTSSKPWHQPLQLLLVTIISFLLMTPCRNLKATTLIIFFCLVGTNWQVHFLHARKMFIKNP
jgi:hypothetical protein